MEPIDAARDEGPQLEPDDGTDRDGAVAIETETGLLVYEPGRPDAWIHAELECAVER